MANREARQAPNAASLGRSARRLQTQFLRFLLIGGLSYVLGTGLVYIFTSLLGIHYLISHVIAFAAVTGISFSLNKFATFSSRRKVGAEIGPYYLLTLCSFGLALAQVYVLVEYVGLWYLTANVAVSLQMLFVNFVGSKLLVFRV